MIDRHTWRGFLLANKNEPMARILLAVGGDSPRITRNRIAFSFERQEIDDESVRIRLYAVECMAERYKDKPFVDFRDPKDWIAIPGGGFRRRVHNDPCGMERHQ